MNSRARIGFGFANLFVATLLASCIYLGLPTRWWVVDWGAAIVIAGLTTSGFALLTNHRLALVLTRIAAQVVLAFGLVTVAILALTLSWLVGVYGPVGKGGGAIFGLVALLIFPYLVILPIVLLVWVGPRRADSAR